MHRANMIRLAVMGQAIGYTIDEQGFTWTGVSKLTAEQVLMPDKFGDQEEKTAIKEAEDFLRGLLADGMVENKTIKKKRRKADITEKTLSRAKTNLKVVSKKIGNNWFWELNQGGQDEKTPKDNSMANLTNMTLALEPQELQDTNQDGHDITLREDSQNKQLGKVENEEVF